MILVTTVVGAATPSSFANRKYFYGANCTFSSDNRAEAEQNSLMAN